MSLISQWILNSSECIRWCRRCGKCTLNTGIQVWNMEICILFIERFERFYSSLQITVREKLLCTCVKGITPHNKKWIYINLTVNRMHIKTELPKTRWHYAQLLPIMVKILSHKVTLFLGIEEIKTKGNLH